jgi:hypothetical protein
MTIIENSSKHSYNISETDEKSIKIQTKDTDIATFLDSIDLDKFLTKKKKTDNDSILDIQDEIKTTKKKIIKKNDLQQQDKNLEIFNKKRFLEFLENSDFSSILSKSIGMSKDRLVSTLIQNLIYLMNDNKLRKEIMTYYINHLELSKDYKWCGTLNLLLNGENNEITFRKKEIIESSNGQYEFSNLDELQQMTQQQYKLDKINFKNLTKLIKTNLKRFTEKKHNLFTVVLVYNGYSCHYVSFIYKKEEKKLISFDPGVLLYTHGQDTIVPVMTRIFKSLGLIESETQLKLGTCNKEFCSKKYGIQFNGRTEFSLAADAFCQTWTIFFLYRYLLSESDVKFVDDWCEVPPQDRECFVLSFFLIPTIMSFKRAKEHYLDILKGSLDRKYTFNEISNILFTYIEKNLLHRFKPRDIVCKLNK